MRMTWACAIRVRNWVRCGDDRARVYITQWLASRNEYFPFDRWTKPIPKPIADAVVRTNHIHFLCISVLSNLHFGLIVFPYVLHGTEFN